MRITAGRSNAFRLMSPRTPLLVQVILRVLILIVLVVFSPLRGLAQAVAEKAAIDNNVSIGVAEIAYRTRAGDTLTSIAERFTGAASNWAALGKINGVSQDTRIAVNTRISIPADLLTDQPTTASVTALSGMVTAIGAGKARTRLKVGASVTEGMQIETSKNSFVTLALIDASRISIPSNSLVQLTSLRSTSYTRSPRTAITIIHGSVESVVTPLTLNKGRYQIFSPSATAGVRGTHFRVAVLADGTSANSLYEGSIDVERAAQARSASRPIVLNAGFGNVATKRAIGAPVPLLAAPQLTAPPIWRDNAEARFAIAPQAGAAAYHLQLATDTQALEPIIETRSASPQIALNNVVEGDYSARLSAVDANGIEGFSRVILVSLRRAASASSAEDTPSVPYLGGADQQQLNLKWLDQNGTKFRVQVARDIDFSRLQFNGVTTRAELNLPRPPLGTYYARVQRQNQDGSVGPFSATQAFIVADQWVTADGLPKPARASAAR